MIERHFTKGDTVSSALYSPCETYRYALTRCWGNAGRLLFVLLNPSTATEAQNDPTVERCERRARALGYGAFRVTNIFALREANPHKMRAAPHPIGPQNDATLLRSVGWADTIIAGWGTHGAHMDRGVQVAAMLGQTGRAVHHLGLTKAGQPRHPLYIAYHQEPQVWLAGKDREIRP